MLCFSLFFFAVLAAVACAQHEPSQYMNTMLGNARGNGAVISNSVHVTGDNKLGFGLEAATNIRTGESLIDLPSEFSLCFPTNPNTKATIAPNLKKLVLDGELSMDQALAVVLLDNHKNDELPGFPFFAKYPTEFVTFPWLPEVAFPLLEYVVLKELVSLWREEFQQSSELISQLFPTHSISEARWALATVYSRSFGGLPAFVETGYAANSQSIPTLESRCLHPVVDLANTPSSYLIHPAAAVKHEDDGRVVLVAQRNITAGEQISVSYGYHDNLSLFGRYGFAMSSNPLDSLCIDPFVLFQETCPNADPNHVFDGTLASDGRLCSEGGKVGEKLWHATLRCCESANQNLAHAKDDQLAYEIERCAFVNIHQFIQAFNQRDEPTQPSPELSEHIVNSMRVLRESMEGMLFQLQNDLERIGAGIVPPS